MASDVDVANRALSRLGAARVQSIDDETKNARAAKNALPIVRAEFLADHPWNCATRRARLFVPAYDVTAAAWIGASSRYRVTAPGHTLRVGDLVSIDGATSPTELNDEFLVGARTSTTFDLQSYDTGEFVDGSAFAAYGSDGVATLKPLFDWRNAFELPVDEDFLRVLEVEDQRDETWGVESGRLVTDLGGPLNVRYVWLNKDTASYSPVMVSAFAARLAAELALEIVDSPNKRELAMIDYRTILAQAKKADAQEQTPAELEESSWVTARLLS